MNKNEREQIFMHKTKNTILKWKYKNTSFNDIEAKVALRLHWKVLNKAKTSLGGTTKNHIKEWLKNQKQPNNFLGPLF